MMSPILADLMYVSWGGNSKVLASSATLSLEIFSIAVMTIVVMLLNSLMVEKGVENSESKGTVIIAMVGMSVAASFVTDSPFVFLVMMELTVMPLGYMIVSTSKDSDKLESIKFMVMMNTLGSVPFMIYCGWGEQAMKSEAMACMMSCSAGMAMFMLLFLIKTPMFMTHVWLTKAHVAASGNCSMVLASIMIKMGTVGLMKFYNNFGKDKSFYVFTAVCMMGAIYLTAVMFRFFDSKTLIAMSSVLHMAMIIPMLVLKKSIAVLSSVMMMVAHGIISYYMFYLITVKYEMTENRSAVSMKSSEASDKAFAMLIVVFAFLNLGVPPLMNFMSETMFMIMMKSMESVSMAVCMALTLLLSVMFTMQLATNNIYGKVKSVAKKTSPSMIHIKSVFYLAWTALILTTM